MMRNPGRECHGCGRMVSPDVILCDSCEAMDRFLQEVEDARWREYPCAMCGTPITSCDICQACAKANPRDHELERQVEDYGFDQPWEY